jgi:capsular polysaccharide transport system permease protein
MHQAEDEVRRSEGLVRAALAGMEAFRDKQGFIDPLSAAQSTGTLLMQDMSEKIRLENDYFVVSKATSPDAPTVVGLKTRIDGIDSQIAQLKSELTGNSAAGRTIAASLATFEELELKRIFAEKLYTMAQDGLERARLKAEQQNIFISTFVQPAMPEDAKYPERLSLSLLIPLGLLIVWGIFALIGAAVEDHRY